MPQFRVHAPFINQLRMGALLGDPPFLQHDDLIAVVDRAEAVGDEDARPSFIFEDAVDVLEEGLLRVGV